MSTLEVTNLVKDFTIRSGLRRATLRAVNDVSFTLTPGRTVALVGESGSGKSTIARIIARLEKPTSGQAVVTGSDDRPVSGRAYRSQVQMIFQDPFEIGRAHV